MAKISVGSWQPGINPGTMTIVKADKTVAKIPTYTGVGWFEWPSTIVGKDIQMTWNWMPGDEFAALDTICNAGAPEVFNPGDGTGRTFNVNCYPLQGDYYRGSGNTSASIRTNVTLTLCIMSQV